MMQADRIPVLIVRPEAGAKKTADAAMALGLRCVIDPLFRIESISWEALQASKFDALLFTSANAVRYAGDKLQVYSGLPVLAVGQATADAAKAAEMKVAVTGKGGVDALLSCEAAKPYRRLLHLTGRHVHGPETECHEITRAAVYDAVAMPLGAKAKAILAAPCVILLHSERAAQHFADEIRSAGLYRAHISVAAISLAVAQQVGAGWANVEAARAPRDDVLLAVTKRLCHEATNKMANMGADKDIL